MFAPISVFSFDGSTAVFFFTKKKMGVVSEPRGTKSPAGDHAGRSRRISPHACEAGGITAKVTGLRPANSYGGQPP